MMNRVMKSVLLAMVALLCFSVGAFAAEVSVTNRVDRKLSVAFAYYDETSGLLVTQGWWHVEPGDERTIFLPADASRDIYYVAYNKDQFVDISTRQSAQIRRWASPRNFRYDTDDTPADAGAWEGRFYRMNGTAIVVDGTPR